MKSHFGHAAIAFMLLAGTVQPAGAQVPSAGAEVNPASVPDLKLTSAQKQTIYTSISNQKQKETAPPTFRVTVGAVVPSAIELQPMPKTLVDLVPELKDYEYAMVANQVLIVHPKNKQIVDVIN